MVRAICLDQELKRFSDLRICMPSTYEEELSFLIGGELVDIETTSHKFPNVYEGKNKPSVISQLLKMSMTLGTDLIKPDQVRLGFIDERKKSLMLRNEMIEYYDSIVELGYEHYLLGLAWGTESVIVEDWSVC